MRSFGSQSKRVRTSLEINPTNTKSIRTILKKLSYSVGAYITQSERTRI